MRTEKEILDRIKAYTEQNEEWLLVAAEAEDYSTRELYRSWIRKNLSLMEELFWALGG